MKVTTYSGLLIDNKIWLSNIMANGLYQLEPELGKLEFVCCFDSAEKFAQYQHKKVLRYNNILIFVPLFSEEINLFNIRDHTQSSIKIRKNRMEETISDAVVFGDELLLFPMKKKDTLIRVNLIDYSVEYDDDFTKKLESYYGDDEICIARCQMVNTYVEFALYGTSYFVQYELTTREITINNVSIENLYISYKRKNRSVVFLTNDTPQIFVLEENGNVKKYMADTESVGNRFFNGVVEYNDITCIYPAFSDQFLFLAEENYSLYSLKLNDDEIINPFMPKFYGYILTNKGICFLPFESEKIYMVIDSKVSNVYIEEDYTIEKMHVNDIQLFDENKNFGLKTYMKALINS